MVHFGILEQPNLLPASSHQESPGWFLHASSSCFLPRTSSHTSLYPHTHTHTHPPKALKISLHLWPAGAYGYMSKPHFLLSFWKQRGVESKAENTWHLSPLGAAREEGKPGFGECGGVLKHLVSVWQRWDNCCYWTARQGIYRCVCALTPGKITSFYNLDLFSFFSASFLAVMITLYLPSSFYRHSDKTLLASFMSETMGHRKQKPSDNNKLLL